MSPPPSRCPGCGLEMPEGKSVCRAYFNVSPECWSVFTEVLEKEYENPVAFGRVHRLTVDTYAVQHAGGPHPDKSVDVHLMGLYLSLERGIAPLQIAPYFQRLISAVSTWPHFPPPEDQGPLTIFDVAAADSPRDHVSCVRDWADQVWRAWSPHHEAAARLAALAFSLPRVVPRRKGRDQTLSARPDLRGGA